MTEHHVYVTTINVNTVNSPIDFKINGIKQHQKG